MEWNKQGDVKFQTPSFEKVTTEDNTDAQSNSSSCEKAVSPELKDYVIKALSNFTVQLAKIFDKADSDSQYPLQKIMIATKQILKIKLTRKKIIILPNLLKNPKAMFKKTFMIMTIIPINPRIQVVIKHVSQTGLIV